MAEKEPALSPEALKQKAQEAIKLRLLGEKQAVRALTVHAGWGVLREGHIQNLMRVVEEADATNVTEIAVALGVAKGMVETLRLFERAAAAPLDTASGRGDNRKRPGGT